MSAKTSATQPSRELSRSSIKAGFKSTFMKFTPPSHAPTTEMKFNSAYRSIGKHNLAGSATGPQAVSVLPSEAEYFDKPSMGRMVQIFDGRHYTSTSGKFAISGNWRRQSRDLSEHAPSR